jgi:hypothetical protein
MKVYLDNCMFNRPFDDQKHIRIRLETEAKLYIQEQIKAGNLKLIWSYMIDFENEQNPFAERRDSIKRWKKWASTDVSETFSILDQANRLVKRGLNGKNALHVASAIAGQAQYFSYQTSQPEKSYHRTLETRRLFPRLVWAGTESKWSITWVCTRNSSRLDYQSMASELGYQAYRKSRWLWGRTAQQIWPTLLDARCGDGLQQNGRGVV